MDSQWFHQTTASNGGFNDKNDAGNMVDLNLKLGLANHDLTNHQINLSDLFNIPVPKMTHTICKFNLNDPNTCDKEINFGDEEHGDINHFGASCDEGIINLNTSINNNGGGNIATNDDEIGHLNSVVKETKKLNRNVMGCVAQNTNHTLRVAGSSNHNLLPPAATLNNYTLLDFSSKNGEVNNRRYLRRQREVYNDDRKACTDCKTKNTPMWRRGPFGVNTLCNACGIRYRKDHHKRKAIEAANGPNNS